MSAIHGNSKVSIGALAGGKGLMWSSAFALALASTWVLEVHAAAGDDSSVVDVSDDGISVGDAGEDQSLVGIDEVDQAASAAPFTAGNLARVCNTQLLGLRQHEAADASSPTLRVMPDDSSVEIMASSGNWYQVDWGGLSGWAHASYLCSAAAASEGKSSALSGRGESSFAPIESIGTPGDRDPFLDSPKTPAGAVIISRAAVGFSYWWDGGAFTTGGSHGSCHGNCDGGNCSHSGSYGADCSGLIAKAWQLSEALPMASNKHPFSTTDFRNGSKHWDHISRSNVKTGDALTYHTGGAGHIFLYEKGDPWGDMTVYEARGCAYGIVHRTRSAGSAYVAIRRDGF